MEKVRRWSSVEKEKKSKLSATEEKILAIQEKLDCWTKFVSELQVPSELAPAFTTGRLELVKMARPRDLKAEEVKVLYDLIGGLLETNAALREHAQLTAELTDQMSGGLNGILAATRRLREFAQFRTPAEEECDGD